MKQIDSALKILKELENKEGILQSTLFSILEDKPAQGISWSTAYDFSVKLGFIIQKKENVSISELGKNILNIKTGEKNEKTLLDYVFKECIFENSEFINIKQFLEKFHEYKNKLILEDEKFDTSDNDKVILLNELGIINYDKVWIIRDDIKNLVFINKENKGKRKFEKEANDYYYNSAY